MIFHQLLKPLSHTYTYLLACEETGKAILVDPVVPTMDRDLALLAKLNLTLAMTVETHVHADHITSALHLREKPGPGSPFLLSTNSPVQIFTLPKANYCKQDRWLCGHCIHRVIPMTISATSLRTQGECSQVIAC